MPLGLVIAAVVLSQITLSIDERRAGSDVFRRLYPGGADGARVILATIGSSMIGVAGVVFSITVVALTMASSQLGPRLLRTFLRDWTNQLSMGTFIATFLYCIISLRAVSASGGSVPAASVTVAVALAVACVAVLIYFIHNATASLQADRVVAGVAQELLAAITHFAPGRLPGSAFAPSGSAAGAQRQADGFPPVQSETCGYVQAVDYGALFRIACEEGLEIQASVRAGHFVSSGSPLARAEQMDDHTASSIRACFLIGELRTEEQDVEYALSQLVEVALRALSPGINDPFTAMTCIDWLGAALSKAIDLGVPGTAYQDEAGEVRLLVNEPEFPDLLDCAFNQIRQAARETPAVLIRLGDQLGELSERELSEDERAAIRRHAGLLRAEVARGSALTDDVSDLTKQLEELEAL